MHMALVTPALQPYRGATGRAWMAQEYGLAVDTSSLLSSGTERDETDDEICSFELGPEPYDPTGQNRLPSDEWLDDHQQGLEPEGSEPQHLDFSRFKVMPQKPSLLDMMRDDMDDSAAVPPQSPERALTPTIGFSYDYTMDTPPDIQCITDTPRHSTPHPDPPTLSARPRPALQPSRPRASSVPPNPKPAKRMAICYQAVTEAITPPISPAHAHAVDRKMDPDTPSPIQKAGRSRGRGTWRAPQKTAPGVGTRSKTRQAELEQIEATLAQAAGAEWPPSPDPTMDIQHMTLELRLSDVPMDAHKELQKILPTLDQNQNLLQPPAARLMTQHQDVFFIPPPRVVGGAQGASTPVSTATLGLIHRHDPSLAAQLREDPGSLASRPTRLRVYSTMRLIRTGMLGQLASLQQWEEAMHRHDDE